MELTKNNVNYAESWECSAPAAPMKYQYFQWQKDMYEKVIKKLMKNIVEISRLYSKTIL